ncbi:hypothetical protein [Lagierella sp.]|uniref:hypothetical protein n=1 Tax=Lagierella sp. TaxID=2849657 RepID=UPI0026096C73|nr:hypothetical protein [Lagierella sp.]
MVDNKILRFIKICIIILIICYIVFEVYGLFNRSFKSVIVHLVIVSLLVMLLYRLISALFRYFRDKRE